MIGRVSFDLSVFEPMNELVDKLPYFLQSKREAVPSPQLAATHPFEKAVLLEVP